MATRARGVTIKTGDESSVPQVELIGDWDLAQSLLNNLPTIVHAGTYAGMNIAAKEVVVIAKKMIRNGGPKWDAHSTAYQKRKKRLGGTDKPWYISGSLYKNIKVVNTRGKVFAGIPPGARGKQYNNKQVTLNKVARILEKGSPRNNIKARPLFGPAFKEYGGRNGVERQVKKSIKAAIRVAMGVSVKQSNQINMNF